MSDDGPSKSTRLIKSIPILQMTPYLTHAPLHQRAILVPLYLPFRRTRPTNGVARYDYRGGGRPPPPQLPGPASRQPCHTLAAPQFCVDVVIRLGVVLDESYPRLAGREATQFKDLASLRQIANAHATGDKVDEGNQELFVLQKIDDNWKIARYCFSSNTPPR